MLSAERWQMDCAERAATTDYLPASASSRLAMACTHLVEALEPERLLAVVSRIKICRHDLASQRFEGPVQIWHRSIRHDVACTRTCDDWRDLPSQGLHKEQPASRL